MYKRCFNKPIGIVSKPTKLPNYSNLSSTRIASNLINQKQQIANLDIPLFKKNTSNI